MRDRHGRPLTLDDIKRGADLRNAHLTGADLRNAQLWGADLRNTRGANLAGANGVR